MAVAALLGASGQAFAQGDPEAGDIDQPPAESEGSHAGSSFSSSGQASGHVSQASDSERAATVRFRSPAPSEDGPSPSSSDGSSGGSKNDDHEAAVGSLGVGFFGVTTVPIMDCGVTPMYPPCAPSADPTKDAPAPTIGLRYWASDTLGIEAAVGLRIASGSFGPPRNEETSQLAFAVHGGVPLALAHSGHFVFELVPQLNFGVASGSISGPNNAGNRVKSTVSGMLLEAGAKVGGEVHFGFMGLPQLSLQGTLGLMLRVESRSATAPNPNGMGSSTTDQKQTAFATGVDGSPWDIFRGAITAIYYFY
jgi:hypothetical protein